MLVLLREKVTWYVCYESYMLLSLIMIVTWTGTELLKFGDFQFHMSDCHLLLLVDYFWLHYWITNHTSFSSPWRWSMLSHYIYVGFSKFLQASCCSRLSGLSHELDRWKIRERNDKIALSSLLTQVHVPNSPAHWVNPILFQHYSFCLQQIYREHFKYAL